MKRDFWIDVALDKQNQVIKGKMLENYVGGRYKISKWDDFKFSLCFFHASKCGDIWNMRNGQRILTHKIS